MAHFAASPVLSRFAIAAFALVLSVMFSSGVAALDRTWTGLDDPGPDGVFNVAGNWNLPFVPGVGDNAIFSLNDTYTVTVDNSPANIDARISAGDVTFAEAAGPNQTYFLSDDWEQTGGQATIDKLNVSITDQLQVNGDGSFRIVDDTTVTANGGLFLGTLAAGDGMATIDGGAGNAYLRVFSTSAIGNDFPDTGTLHVENGGTVDFFNLLTVAQGGTGVIDVDSNSSVQLDANLLMASVGAGANVGTISVAGANALFDQIGNNTIIIGSGGGSTASIDVSAGGKFSTSGGTTTISDTGSISVDAGTFEAQGSFNATGNVSLDNSSLFDAQAGATLDGATTIENGSSLSASGGITVASSGTPIGNVTVDGPGSQMTATGFANFVQSSALSVTNGASATALGFNFGVVGAGNVSVDVAAGDSTLSADTIVLGGVYDGFDILSGGSADVNVAAGGIVEYTEFMSIFAGSTFNLNGGELRAPDFLVFDDAGLNFNAGLYHVTGDATFDANVASALPSGTLGFGRAIQVDGETTFSAPLVIDGGSFTTGTLVGGSLVQLSTGTLGVTGAGGLAVGASGPIAQTVHLPLGARIEVTNTLTVDADGLLALAGGTVKAGTVSNNGQIDLEGVTSEIDAGITFNAGLLSGDGRITGGPLSNLAAGTVIVAAGDQLRLTAAGNTNSGEIDLQGGRLQVDSDLHNLATGNIVGRGALAAVGGLTNDGDLALSNGQTDIFGDVDNQTNGRVLISGNADVTFWGDVTHTGTAFNVSGGSSVTFFGDAGFGVSGAGDVFFEDDITPGSSPGVETFGGDVYFGALSTLEIEIGGTMPGTEFDRLEIAGNAHLGGTLKVELIDLGGGIYEPQLGDSFGFLASQLGAGGVFANFDLPELLPGLEWQLNPGGVTVFLNVVAALPGDYNFDGTVDAIDYTTWRDALGQSGIGLAADGDLSGTIDEADYLIWKTNYGMTAPAVHAAASVPEPATLWSIIALAACATALFRIRAYRTPLNG